MACIVGIRDTEMREMSNILQSLHEALHNEISRNLFGCVGQRDKSHATQNIPLRPCSYTCAIPIVILLNGTPHLRGCARMHPGTGKGI